MRFLITPTLLVVVLSFSATCGAQQTNVIPAELSLETLLTKLSSDDETIRSEASDLLPKMIEMLAPSDADIRRPILGIYAANAKSEGPELRITETQRAALRQQIQSSTPRIVSLLKTTPRDESSMLWQLLVLSDPLASFLDDNQEIEQLISKEDHCWGLYQALLSTGILSAPPTESVLSSTVRLLGRLTKDQLRNLESTLQKEQISLFGPTTAGIAISISYGDHVQAELSSLAKLLNPKHPKTLRLMCLAVLAELQAEARPVLPRIGEALKDEDMQIRCAAAFAILGIDQETFDIERVAVQARLNREDHAELGEAARESAENAAKYMDAEPILSPAEIGQFLIADKTNVGKRAILREAIRAIRHSESDLSSIRKAIEREAKSGKAENETRRLAKLALMEIDKQVESNTKR